VFACLVYQVGQGGTIAAGIVSLLVAHFGIGLIVRKKITKVQNALQEKLVNGQKQVQRKIQLFQTKPGGNIKQIQRQLENDQKALLSEAVVFVDRFEPFKKWSLLMGRQIATMRMQFLYQLKKFDEVDQLLAGQNLFKGPLMMEPMMIAMKMARQFKNGDVAGAEKTFKRRIKWFRGNRGTLLYAVMSWIYMQQGESEKARQLLLKAKEVTADKTLAGNWEMLSNNKDAAFSNAGLGDEWYGLYLEAPPMPKQQRIRSNGRRPF
jgi:tetratricopeptide (TPR) repeat protein